MVNADAHGRDSADDQIASDAHRLVRSVAAWFLEPASRALPRVEEAALDGIGDPYNADPVLAQEVRESTRLNVQHWVSTMANSPSVPVTPTLAGPVVGIAREVIRRGADRAVWTAYHVAKEKAWRIWMQRSFEVQSEPAVLALSLDLVSTSLGSWVRATLDELTALVQREREDYVWQSHTQRLAIVTSILDEDPPDLEVAERRLGYRFRGDHLAAVLWTDAAMPDQAALMRAASELQRRFDAPQLVAVPASSSSLWLWLGSHEPLDPRLLTEDFDDTAVRLAVGSPGDGVEGFRRSHFDAVSAQNLLLRVHGVRAAAFDDIALVHLTTQNEQAARAFVSRVLGDLSAAHPDLRMTVRAYGREGHSVARTAQALFTHRNTVLNRLQRAEQLLPGRWDARSLELAAALEIDHWLGPLR
jgi:DNA-binding PucR family transcriptional regulator